jgi:hypothetical protein
VKHVQLGWKPIPSSRFGFDPFKLDDNVRKFYERWHAQGGESARDHCGVMKRAKDMPDLRSYLQQQQWAVTEWKLKQCRADLRIIELTDCKKKLRVIK